MMKTIQIKYYAAMREERGVVEESVVTEAANLADLYDEMKQKYQFSLERQVLRVAANNEFVTWETPLQDHDAVIFVPPVNGG